MSALGVCPGCSRTWGGERACHCSVCHRQFAGLSGFDAHRPGECLDPASLRSKKTRERLYRQDEKGVWRSSAERPDFGRRNHP